MTLRAWFPFVRRTAQPRVRLVCLPYAGGGATTYRTWQRWLPPAVELWAAQPPGRETRLAEPPVSALGVLVDSLADALEWGDDVPWAIFGHSLGALVGFELARQVRERGGRGPALLIASARHAPDTPRREPPVDALSDDEFVARLQRLNGIRPEILAHAELMAMLLPILRADFRAYQRYCYQPQAPLETPLAVFGGLADPDLNREDLEKWRPHSARFRGVRMFAGDHFYLQAHPDEVVGAVLRELGDLL